MNQTELTELEVVTSNHTETSTGTDLYPEDLLFYLWLRCMGEDDDDE